MPQPFADELRSIHFSPKLGESLERARTFAREQSHRAVLLEHLLLALTEDPDAAAVMQACSVDPVRLGTDVSGYLGRLLEDMRAPAGVEPRADAELLRVLQAAGQAAQQSRRRQIDGAIVLAAIVGDGKSPAAGLLKAHGLTFEEAIRALQKSTTASNAKARSQLYAPPAKASAGASAAASAPPAAAAPVPVSEPQPPPPLAASEDEHTVEAAQTTQSVDEILAAARARIQARSTAIAAKPEAKARPEPVPQAEAKPLPLATLSSAMPAPSRAAADATEDLDDDALEDLPVAPAQPAVPVPRSAGWTPPAPPVQQPSGRLPPPPRSPAGMPNRPPRSAKGAPRPPVPPPPRPDAPAHLGRPSGAIQPGLPPPPQQAPWPYPHAPGHSGGPPASNGALADPANAPARPRTGQRTGGQGGGPLMETIPRRMRVGAPSSAQVRIARDKIDGLIKLLLSGRGMAHRPDAIVTRALSVRLKAPDGGFAIEPDTAETQWVEATPPGVQHDEFVSWRWTVTPQRRGRSRLLLVVTARTVGRDGLATETAPPDRVIEVAVTGRRLRGLMRWIGLLTVLGLGVAAGRFGSELWSVGSAVLKRFTGG